jgi:endonuclease III
MPSTRKRKVLDAIRKENRHSASNTSSTTNFGNHIPSDHKASGPSQSSSSSSRVPNAKTPSAQATSAQIHTNATIVVDDGSGPDGLVNKAKRRKTGIQKLQRGYTPGVTPFPNWLDPLPKACEEVYKLLSNCHQDLEHRLKRQAVIARASLERAGCGEVPTTVDAVLRTVLSGHTSMENANIALKGLVRTFGTVFADTEQESVNWNAVRRAPRQAVEQAIKAGGLATSKSRYIKDILDQVWRQGCQRIGVDASHDLTACTDDEAAMSILSLEHLQEVSKSEAITELTKFPGIGVKTAACVTLFCLRKECFAVDTHVHRFCRWLRWVPDKATAEQTFNHGEMRVPDHLKYGLHQLFIRHGRACFRCRTDTRPGAKGWDECVCPLENLVDRGKQDNKRKTKDKTSKATISSKKSQGDKNIASDDIKEEAKVTRGVESAVETVINPVAADDTKVRIEDCVHGSNMNKLTTGNRYAKTEGNGKPKAVVCSHGVATRFEITDKIGDESSALSDLDSDELESELSDVDSEQFK